MSPFFTMFSVRLRGKFGIQSLTLQLQLLIAQISFIEEQIARQT